MREREDAMDDADKQAIAEGQLTKDDIIDYLQARIRALEHQLAIWKSRAESAEEELDA